MKPRRTWKKSTVQCLDARPEISAYSGDDQLWPKRNR
ncbi:hypothetical protein CryarDRAFT_3468 [Cryptosporangium arvum DSM 44712]|uniref:Uncharacterized protein n=1 Tax=Cryptosporangium arvum DSM 44712 TaxID=927661 RepID=A0A010ZYN3_9ACTN|nr:hypothetical protein CryarDRAFT_3468 [Cryptosporangium arvum DSM 44712]